ncbi:MAG: hypothetical protein ABSC08_08080, partial [Bryobacteraceae bacterium]
MSDYLKVLLSLIPIAALAWAVFVWRRDNRRRLTIRQVGSNIENVVLALDVGAAFILNAAITNDSPKLTIVIHHFDLGLLWCDPEFDWLDDPLERVPSS